MDKVEIEINPLLDWEEQKNTKILEFLIKKEGIWIFHKYDKDPFPSTPHGHNKETGEKLDVYTGIKYDKHGNISGKLGRKKLIEIQDKLRSAEFNLK